MDALLVQLGALMTEEDQARVEGMAGDRGLAGGAATAATTKPRSSRKMKETTGEGKFLTLRF
jgi:hypothetical protein